MVNVCLPAKLFPDDDRPACRIRNVRRCIGLFVSQLFRPAMFVTFPDLRTVRIVVILAEVEGIDASFGFED
ncbi:MAG: hypothetical protein D6690_04645 [Nitrospirae bacterium]|nr:MAG: hypothetical protein D6690_04645 [Nitrospirota bacterium]